MKKLLLCLAVAATASATTSLAQSGQLGLKAGATLSRYVGNGAGDRNSATGVKDLVGFQAGLTYALPLSEDGFFSLQPELLYTQKGSKVNDTGREVTSRLHYLDLPVLARVRAGGLVFEAGPQLSLLLAHSGGYLGDKFNPALTSSASYHTLDFGAVAGVGYQSEQGYSVGVRYSRGFNELFRDFAGILVSPYNSGFQLHAGYVFGQR